jgi:hypothetical protein
MTHAQIWSLKGYVTYREHGSTLLGNVNNIKSAGLCITIKSLQQKNCKQFLDNQTIIKRRNVPQGVVTEWSK